MERDLQVWIGEVEGGPLVRIASRGPEVRCPSCEKWEAFMQYTPLQLVQRYARFLLPVLKCRNCNHVFALDPTPERNDLVPQEQQLGEGHQEGGSSQGGIASAAPLLQTG